MKQANVASCDALIVIEASVIIPSKGRPHQLRQTLEAVHAQSGADLEVLVVDDSGTKEGAEETRVVLQGHGKLVLGKGRGPGAARNLGAMLARGTYLLFTDDDCLPQPDWAASLIARLGDSEDQWTAVGGSTVAAGRDLYSRYYDLHRVLDPMPHDPSHPDLIPYMVTANCGIRRETFFRIGGFDEDIPFAGGEDVGLSLKLIRAGGHIVRVPEAIVHHRFRPGVKAMRRMFHQYGQGGRHVVDRYLPIQVKP